VLGLTKLSGLSNPTTAALIDPGRDLIAAHPNRHGLTSTLTKTTKNVWLIDLIFCSTWASVTTLSLDLIAFFINKNNGL
jgi:hypothetical protein